MGHTFGCVSVWPRCPRGTGGIPHEKSPPIVQAHRGGRSRRAGVPPVPGPSPSARVAAPSSTFLVCRWARPPPRVDPARGGSLSAQVGSRGWPSLSKSIASWKEGARSAVMCRDLGCGALPLSSPAPPPPSTSGRGWGAPVRLLDNGPRAPSGFLRGDRFRLSKSLRLRSFSPACTPPSSRLAPPAWRSC